MKKTEMKKVFHIENENKSFNVETLNSLILVTVCLTNTLEMYIKKVRYSFNRFLTQVLQLTVSMPVFN